MSETVGRVDFIAGLDGRPAVREARAVGEEIGKAGDKSGAEFGDRFERGLTPRMRAAADRAAKAVSDGIQLDGKVFDRNRAEIDRFARDTRMAFRDMFPTGSKILDGVDTRIRSVGYALDESRIKARDFWNQLDVDRTRLDRFNVQWSDLSHNTRQWSLIIGAVLAAMQDLAVLSSALGGGIMGVGSALSTAVLGAGAAVAVFSVLGKDIGKLPPELRDTATQFRALGQELLTTRDIIASSAIREMPDTFDRLSGTVKGLNPSLSALGTSVGIVFDRFSKGVATGTDGFRELDALIANAAKDFPALAAATGTWAGALLRGFNKANPLADQLIGYLDKIGERFDSFTRSNSFDQWIANSMTTFRSFGELLDATSRALNDLVTPESIVRTQQFLDNLTNFMPNLSRLLDVLGRVDVFGLAAQLLNELGMALEPLAGPAADLADALNEVASIVISELAVALGVAADIAAPLAKGLADVISAIPPGVMSALAASVMTAAAAFVVLKGVQGVAGAVDALGLFAGVAGRVETGAGKMAGALRGLAGKAGLFGLVAVGAAALAQAGVEVARSMSNVETISANLLQSNSSLSESYLKLNDATKQGFDLVAIKDWDKALTDLSYTNDGVFANMANAWRDGATEAFGLAGALGELDKPLADLAENNLPAATSQFSAWAREVGATDAQVLNMINSMPEFRTQLESAATASGQLASDSNLVEIALGGAKFSVEDNTDALAILGSTAYLTGAEVDTLAGKIRNFGDQNLTARDAARNYEASLDTLTESIKTNGATLEIGTEQGRANEAAIDALAVATLDLSAKTLTQTGEQSKANDVIAKGRGELIKVLDQFGITGAAAERYADKLGLIPADVSSTIKANGLAEAYSTTRNLQYHLEQVNGSTYSYTMRGTYIQVGNREVTPYASGGKVFGATRALIGEAGPEAVVPLNRPLSQVDPSVRALSAFAQGIPFAGGGIAGGGRTELNIMPGAIVVQGSDDPRAVALEVVDAIAEYVTS
ncbi:tape measure protein [Microbacterium phage SadLad]|nr:tape measure protein [Microbacterium phage SadLad]